MGANAGSTAGELISKITGWGDYTVSQNSILKTPMKMGLSAAQFSQSSRGVEISHREFLGDISGSDPFRIKSLNINPGLSESFPWLSRVAANYEQYEFLGLVYEFRPTSGSIAGASPALGVVVFATNYDSLDTTFTSKQQMESYQFATSVVPCEGMSHPVECDPADMIMKNHYVRTQAAPAGSDQRMYDWGKFQYATKGMQSEYVCGELWVTYHVRLIFPRIDPNVSTEIVHLSSSTESATTAAPFQGAIAVSDPYGWISGPTPVLSYDNTGITFFNPGRYHIAASWYDATGPLITGNAAVSGSPGANIQYAPAIYRNRTSALSSAAQTDSAVYELAVTITSNGTGSSNKVVFTGPAGLASGFVDVIITKLPTVFI